MSHLFGPVPSRRLGLSLGVDLLPFKTCTLDCVYCQLGRTTCLTLDREEHVSTAEVLAEIRTRAEAVDQGREAKFDYLTLAGSGEPLLHRGLEDFIRGAKEAVDKPVALLTNGTLFFREEVRREVLEADLIIPSLDAATAVTFQRVNRPHSDLSIEEVIEGLVRLREEYSGEIWLEVMLVSGFNDSEAPLIAEAAEKIDPDRIQLNTVVRPPAEPVQPLSPVEMVEILEVFSGAEVIAEWTREGSKGTGALIIDLLARRPCTLEELAALTALHRNEILKNLELLEAQGEVSSLRHGGHLYFQAPDR
ncbi:radical SAM protein [Candidatus Methanocrinis natronophilus]|uniref:Radical SAM protein n=1 Tax=Candidatus Methanocrinis natronophilus TaxID=3033396 RepID=A0ABT5X4X1_9EURY|nr:radical SAM protein [Candidatus Methanocrinis natronophilus]MDF0589739.1 radical SAM protein [Candidatus Methanocrinis natronophilus]